MDFYDDVLLELVTALGAALFVANAFALIRRGADRRQAAKAAVARSRPGSPVRAQVRASTGRLDQAPLARSVTFMLFGLVVAVWGLVSIFS
ncbi:MAG: hypothetical protein ACKOA9_10475 [Actinomycetota bacterium]